MILAIAFCRLSELLTRIKNASVWEFFLYFKIVCSASIDLSRKCGCAVWFRKNLLMLVFSFALRPRRQIAIVLIVIDGLDARLLRSFLCLRIFFCSMFVLTLRSRSLNVSRSSSHLSAYAFCVPFFYILFVPLRLPFIAFIFLWCRLFSVHTTRDRLQAQLRTRRADHYRSIVSIFFRLATWDQSYLHFFRLETAVAHHPHFSPLST